MAAWLNEKEMKQLARDGIKEARGLARLARTEMRDGNVGNAIAALVEAASWAGTVNGLSHAIDIRGAYRQMENDVEAATEFVISKID